MQSSNRSIFAFLAGWSLARKRSRSTGLSFLVMFATIFSCCTAFMTLTFALPFSFLRSREVANLPRPTIAELHTTAPGTPLLVVAQIPPNAKAESHRLALFYSEIYTKSASSSTTSPTPASGGWQLLEQAPARFDMRLPDESPLTVQFSEQSTFYNAQQIKESSKEGSDSIGDKRYTGYLAGQTLTIEGYWEGKGLLTVRACYAGTPDEYVSYLRSLIGGTFMMGLFCGDVSIFFLFVGFALRFMNR